MLSQFKMNPDPAYQNRLLPERDNASFFDGYSVWFYKEQGDLQQDVYKRQVLTMSSIWEQPTL